MLRDAQRRRRDTTILRMCKSLAAVGVTAGFVQDGGLWGLQDSGLWGLQDRYEMSLQLRNPDRVAKCWCYIGHGGVRFRNGRPLRRGDDSYTQIPVKKWRRDDKAFAAALCAAALVAEGEYVAAKDRAVAVAPFEPALRVNPTTGCHAYMGQIVNGVGEFNLRVNVTVEQATAIVDAAVACGALERRA